MDVATGFLNGELKGEVYIKQPDGFVTKGQEHLVCRLKRSFYGFKQSSGCWNVLQTNCDPCIHVFTVGEMFVIAVHVGDVVLTTKSDNRMAEVKRGLAEGFEG